MPVSVAGWWIVISKTTVVFVTRPKITVYQTCVACKAKGLNAQFDADLFQIGTRKISAISPVRHEPCQKRKLMYFFLVAGVTLSQQKTWLRNNECWKTSSFHALDNPESATPSCPPAMIKNPSAKHLCQKTTPAFTPPLKHGKLLVPNPLHKHR